MATDVKKMPLGKLSKAQIAKGYEVLNDLKTALDSKKPAAITELSSSFYTSGWFFGYLFKGSIVHLLLIIPLVIPHSFGRNVPPAINTRELIQQKTEMLQVQ